jgi:probable HAF family extracellular repeat protein
VIVGSSSTGSATHAFVYSDGSISDLLPTAVSGTLGLLGCVGLLATRRRHRVAM